MGAIEHASHFGWENSARKTLDVYDLIIGRNKNNSKYRIFKNQ
jgi:D-inositol-3-phosphate glycosyltransferase